MRGAICSSNTHIAVVSSCGTRNGLLNSRVKTNQAAKKTRLPSEMLRRVLTHQAQSVSTFLSNRIMRDLVPSKYRTVRFSAIQSCMVRGSTKHCVRRLTLYCMSWAFKTEAGDNSNNRPENCVVLTPKHSGSQGSQASLVPGAFMVFASVRSSAAAIFML